MHAFSLSRIAMCFLSLSFFFFAFLFIFSSYLNIYPPSFSSPLFFYVDPKPLSVYHPTSREVLAAMGMPMKGFFNEADIVVEAMAFTSIAAQGAPAEAPIPPPKPVPIEESTQTDKVGEFVPIPAKIPTP